MVVTDSLHIIFTIIFTTVIVGKLFDFERIWRELDTIYWAFLNSINYLISLEDPHFPNPRVTVRFTYKISVIDIDLKDEMHNSFVLCKKCIFKQVNFNLLKTIEMYFGKVGVCGANRQKHTYLKIKNQFSYIRRPYTPCDNTLMKNSTRLFE